MLGQTHTEERFCGTNRAGSKLLHLNKVVNRLGQAGVYQEQRWRCLVGFDKELAARTNILVSRWLDHRTTHRLDQAIPAADRYVVAIALRPIRLRLARSTHTLFEGTMAAGTLHVTGPSRPLQAEFHGPSDFIHLHVAADYLRNRQAAALAGPCQPERDLNDFMMRDPLAAQLALTLAEEVNADDRLYAESVGQTIVMRLLALRPSPSRTSALPKWRLRRVIEHIMANIGEPICLADLAAAAGLSRMHFAAQFRVATGCPPHEYVLQQRIECAKAMLSSTGVSLAEVALNVGFQTQPHFSTVFKRLTGEAPGRWQRINRSR